MQEKKTKTNPKTNENLSIHPKTHNSLKHRKSNQNTPKIRENQKTKKKQKPHKYTTNMKKNTQTNENTHKKKLNIPIHAKTQNKNGISRTQFPRSKA